MARMDGDSPIKEPLYRHWIPKKITAIIVSKSTFSSREPWNRNNNRERFAKLYSQLLPARQGSEEHLPLCLLFAGRIEDVVPKTPSRFETSLVRFKLRYFETVSTIVVLVLFTAFAFHEIRPVIEAIWRFFHVP